MHLKDIPDEPGCYLFKDSGGNILYIGKAKDLKKRVSSYFQKKDQDPKTRMLAGNIASVDYIITGNEKEAFILENNLIKKHNPRYNIDLKDSKRYAYIQLTKEDFPRLLIARRRTGEGSYFGPFTSSDKRDSLLRFANNVFRLRTCRRLPKKACTRFHMDFCSAPCINRISKEDYSLHVEDAKKLLSGGNNQLLRELRDRMRECSGDREYEQARILRDRITAIESLRERQSMETQRQYDQDIINYVVDDSTVHLAVFNAYRGVLSNKDEFDFDYNEGFLEEFILQYYSEGNIPQEIILPQNIPPALNDYLSDRRGSSVKVTVPVRGEKKNLLDLVRKNVEKSFLEDDLRMQDLRVILGLKEIPRIIECFDVSHLSGTNPAGSMVRFLNGKPDKIGYRRFRIKTVEGVDDYAMIGELVGRRYKRLVQERKELPNLIVIDGGRGQLSFAFTELERLGLKIPVIAIAKKLEEVYLPGLSEPQSFDLNSRGMKLLQNVRDEAHRFAVGYHRLLRKGRVLGRK